MVGVSGIGAIGVGLKNVRIATEFQALAIRRQVDALNLQGDLAIQLIQSAVVSDPAVGRSLDITA